MLCALCFALRCALCSLGSPLCALGSVLHALLSVLCALCSVCAVRYGLCALLSVPCAWCSVLDSLCASAVWGGPSGDATGHRFLSSGRAVVQDPSVFAEWSGRRAADTKTSVFARDEDPHGVNSRVWGAFLIEPPGASWVRPGGGALGRRHGTSIFFEWEGRRSESLGFFRVGRASRRREENTVKMQAQGPRPFQFSGFGHIFNEKMDFSCIFAVFLIRRPPSRTGRGTKEQTKREPWA